MMAAKTFRRRLLRWLAGFVLLAVAFVLAGAVIVWTGAADRWARAAIVSRLEQMTGARVELGGFHFELWGLRARLTNLTLHGREPEGTPPLFHADELYVDVRVDSFFRRAISLDEVRVVRPAVHVRIEANGVTNVPAPPVRQASGKPIREQIFDLVIRRLRIENGAAAFNDVRVPLEAEGGQFELGMEYSAAPGPLYSGELHWQDLTLVLRRYLPFHSDLAARFTLERTRFELNQLRWELPHSRIEAEASTEFAPAKWDFRYRGKLDLEDFRHILRKPNSPSGAIDFSGEGTYAAGRLAIAGNYNAHDVRMLYDWFHVSGMSSRGSYHADKNGVEVPDFEARALGGEVRGRLNVAFRGQAFRTDMHARGMRLEDLLAAVDNAHFPVAKLHWAGAVDVDAVTTWERDFQNLDSRGESMWSPASAPSEGKIPATARLPFHYSMARRTVELTRGFISLPSARIELDGTLGAVDSELAMRVDARDITPFDDFINRLRGADAEPQRIAGSALWQGRILGPLEGPEFTGHLRASNARYGQLAWDEIEGDLTYSPDELRFQRGHARRGRSSATLELRLYLRDWSFRLENTWSLEATLDRAPVEDLQGLFGWSYPVRGLLSGTFRGSGTRAAPEVSATFDLAEGEAWSYRFERFRGQLEWRPSEVRLAHVELRAFPFVENGSGPGLITGNFAYHSGTGETEFDLTGAAIRLEAIQRIQTPRFPLGGRLNFQLRGGGPLAAPTAKGSLRIVDLRVGKEVLGSFDAQLDSDGKRLHLELASAMATGRITGRLNLGLGGEYPIDGELDAANFDLDPFIQSALHIVALTAHSSGDGHFKLSGSLAKPETITIEAALTRLVFEFEHIKLENAGPVRLTYRRDEVRVEQAELRGADTDLHISGFARFAGDRRVGLNLSGTVNLGLVRGFVPALDANGRANINAAVSGTFATPLITGRVHIEDASARYGDIPTGLSRLTGDFVFDSTRLLFDNVTAETGGGLMRLSGTVTYGEVNTPVRYDVSARAERVRIRYPEGMSWLAGGTLRFSGTRQGALLSGRVTVERLLMSQGFDLAGMIIAAKEPVSAPRTSSPFLRNLQFDVEAVTTADARMEWPGASFESEGSVRVRGTWEHPILLGHLHLLTGEMTFRGNRYKLTRGDINFSNPLRLDPVLNVEAVTTIRQYEVTLNFTGPVSKLTLAYRSDPPLPSSDIIALLALGRTGEESQLRGATAVQTPELGATTLLSEAISSQLGGRIERLFGISRFRVDPFLAGTGVEQNAAARITIEQQVTHDVVITYITNVTSSQQQVIQIEYAVNRDVSIIALRDQNGTFGLDVKFKKRFK